MATATTDLGALSLHAALPIYSGQRDLDDAPRLFKLLGLQDVVGVADAPELQGVAEVARRDLVQPLALRDRVRSEEHTSELQSHSDLVCRLLLEKKNSTDS